MKRREVENANGARLLYYEFDGESGDGESETDGPGADGPGTEELGVEEHAADDRPERS